MKIENFEQKAKEALFDNLKNIPFLKLFEPDFRPEYSNIRPDIFIILHIHGEDRRIVAEIMAKGEPRYARQAAYKIKRYRQDFEFDYGILIVPYISSQAANICLEEGIGYLDLAGNCHISFDKIYIHVEGNPNPFTRNQYLRSLFSPKAERILRVLLGSGSKEWKVEELASEADVSLGQVSNVKKLLEEQEWLDSKAIGFSLTKPFDLLEEWSINYKYHRNKIFNFYSLQSPAEFEYTLAEVCRKKKIRYGLTGFSGSTRYAPAVRYQKVTAYVLAEINELTNDLGIKSVDTGSNVLLLKPYDEGVFYGAEDIFGAIVVSPIQAYLDLRSNKGRGEEAAEALLDGVIRKLW